MLIFRSITMIGVKQWWLWVSRYDVVFVNLTHKPEWLLDKSPLGKVPCIEFENGDTLYESLIMADYLNEAYPENSLYPQDPLLKAKDKLLVERFNSVITTMYKVRCQLTILFCFFICVLACVNFSSGLVVLEIHNGGQNYIMLSASQ